MATVGKFRSYKTMFLQYRRQRFGFMKFAGLSVLIVMLGISEKPEGLALAGNFAFVFVALFIFRWIDDAWSFYLDRPVHPDRTYLRTENIRKFFILGLTIFITWLVALSLYSASHAQTILALFLFSNIFYLAFYRNKSAMLIIPLFKYPVILWCIAGFSLSAGVLLLSAGLFFIMLAVDFWEKHPLRNDGILIKLILLIISGLLVFQPWTSQSGMQVVLISLPLLFLLFKQIKTFHVFPIVIYPILHIINLLIKL